MSELSQLKSKIDAIAQQAKSTGVHLGSFSSRFGQASAEVSSTIGGSTQRKDQEVVAAIDEARSKVDAAVQALQTAARVAQSYGQSL